MPDTVSIAEVASSVLTFAGGLLLVIDVYSPVRAFYVKLGEEKSEWMASRLSGKKAQPKVPSDEALQHAERSQALTRWGFSLVTLGFLIDFLNKTHLIEWLKRPHHG